MMRPDLSMYGPILSLLPSMGTPGLPSASCQLVLVLNSGLTCWTAQKAHAGQQGSILLSMVLYPCHLAESLVLSARSWHQWQLVKCVRQPGKVVPSGEDGSAP